MAETGNNRPGRADETQRRDLPDDVEKEVAGRKATEFDGNPNPQGQPHTAFKPKDDTPFILPKQEGMD